MSWPASESSWRSRHVSLQRFTAQSALKSLLVGGLMLIAAQVSGGDDMQPKVKVDDSSFKCITEMTPVRHFYVDNLLGNLAETVAIAQVGKGEYPEGSSAAAHSERGHDQTAERFQPGYTGLIVLLY